MDNIDKLVNRCFIKKLNKEKVTKRCGFKLVTKSPIYFRTSILERSILEHLF
jgi:hypothetical protein